MDYLIKEEHEVWGVDLRGAGRGEGMGDKYDQNLMNEILEELSKIMFKKSFSSQVVQRQNNNKKSWVWPCAPVTPVLRGQRQEDCWGCWMPV